MSSAIRKFPFLRGFSLYGVCICDSSTIWRFQCLEGIRLGRFRCVYNENMRQQTMQYNIYWLFMIRYRTTIVPVWKSCCSFVHNSTYNLYTLYLQYEPDTSFRDSSSVLYIFILTLYILATMAHRLKSISENIQLHTAGTNIWSKILT